MEQEGKNYRKGRESLNGAECCQVLMCLMVLFKYKISHPTQSTTSTGSA